MNVTVTCRGGLHPPSHQLRLSIEYDWHHVEGRMQSAPTKLVCSLSEITLLLPLGFFGNLCDLISR
jgi:hypothetical protein